MTKPKPKPKTTALAPYNVGALTQVIDDLSGEEFHATDLPLIHAGSGGGRNWMPKRGADAPADGILEGVVIHWESPRVYWEGEYTGGGDPPDCYADDGIYGIGNPGGECAICPMNQFGSAEKGRGKACSEKRMLYVLPEGALIPTIVQVSAASLKNWKQYLLSMVNHGGVKRWTTEVSLTRATSDFGPYDQVAFNRKREIPPEAEKKLRSYADHLTTILARSAPSPVHEGE